MGAPKLKWTSEEEGALRAGVEKYGAGKWRTILKDPEFAPCLQARSNVDLKDKWRNLTSSVSRGGRGSKSPRQKLIAPGPLSLATPRSPATAVSAAAANSDNADITSPSTSTTARNQMPRCDYDDMMVEVITPMQNANETDSVIFATTKEMDFINKASMNCLPTKILEEDAMVALAEAEATTTEADNDLLWLIEAATEAENDVIWSDEAAAEAENDILWLNEAVTEAENDVIWLNEADILL